MPYTTLVAGTVITAAWANANVRDQTVSPFASTAARDSAISSPVAGMVEYLTTNDATEGLTTRTSAGTWRLPWNQPWGYIATATATTDQTGISTTVTTVTGMDVTWTAVANRVYAVHAYLSRPQQITAGGEQIFQITNGSNVQQGLTAQRVQAANDTGALNMVNIELGITAGSTTRRLRCNTSAGTMNTNGATSGGRIYIVDMGPNGAPS
jgi:hypothetical protein